MSKRKTLSSLLVIAIIVIIAALLLQNSKLREPTPKNQNVAEKIQTVESTPPKSQAVQTVPAKKEQVTDSILPQPPKVEVLSDEDNDLMMAELITRSTDEISKDVASIVKNPVHHGRAELQKQIQQETAQDTFMNITDNLNIAMVTPKMAGRPFSTGYYAADVKMMCKMTRIRKLLEDARENPGSISSFLQEQLLAMAEKFPSAYEEYMQLLKSTKGKLVLDELSEADKYRLLSTTAVYVLSEINAHDSLPVLAKLSTKSNSLSSNFAGNCQVNPKFLLYSMHRLVKQFPEGQLSEEAQEARREYLAMAERVGIPAPRKREFAAWDARYHEDDFRKILPGRKLYTRDDPTIELAEFPPLDKLNKGNVNRLLKKIRTFVDIAFTG